MSMGRRGGGGERIGEENEERKGGGRWNGEEAEEVICRRARRVG